MITEAKYNSAIDDAVRNLKGVIKALHAASSSADSESTVDELEAFADDLSTVLAKVTDYKILGICND